MNGFYLDSYFLEFSSWSFLFGSLDAFIWSFFFTNRCISFSILFLFIVFLDLTTFFLSSRLFFLDFKFYTTYDSELSSLADFSCNFEFTRLRRCLLFIDFLLTVFPVLIVEVL